MKAIRHLSIATKLFIWSCLLIAFFFAATTYLFQQVRKDAEVSNRIATTNHEIDAAIQRMLDRLNNIQENIRRYRLVGSKDAVEFIVTDLTKFGQILDETLAKYPHFKTEWQDLKQEFEITLDPTESDGFAPDETILEWTDILEQSQMENLSDVEVSLTQLHESGRRAANIGLYGLIGCLLLGIGGSLTLAYHINRSLKEIQSGIRKLGTGTPPKDVRVLAGDELGQLAEAFNSMADRLRSEEAMRADFIAMLSHEIRTPLTSIRESVDLIGSGTFGEVNDRQKRFLSIAEKESVRLSNLLTRLMTVSQMESHTLELTLTHVDCTDLVQSTLSRLSPMAETKRIALETTSPPAPLWCVCDAEQIRQVLLNLIGNAIKFSPEGETVTVALSSSHDTVNFAVSDNGPGISEEEQKRIFIKYYRDQSVRESIDGAGLGLTIAHRIVDAHSGRIHIESELGNGATFHFSLPVKQQKD